MLLSRCVLSNTDLDDIQVAVNKRKYKNAEYDDNMIEFLMKYSGLENYEELEDFLKHSHIPIYN
jgi:hypothetical protein